MMGKLSDSEKKEITKRICRLVLEHINAGVFTSTRVLCHNCGYTKPLIGTSRYGKYQLCNDYALKYELAQEEGRVNNIEAFVLDERLGEAGYRKLKG